MLKFKEWFSHHHEDNAMEGHLTQKHYTNPYLIMTFTGNNIIINLCNYG